MGVDYALPRPMEVTFPPYPSEYMYTKCIDVTIIDDEDYEGLHSFTIVFGDISVPPSVGTAHGNTLIFIEDDNGKNDCHRG